MTLSLIESVQIEIGDTPEGPGVLPGKRHFKHSEFSYAAGSENVTEFITPSPRDIGRVSAKCLEIASVAWSSQPEEVELGPSIEKGKQAKTIGRQAAVLRAIWGYGGTGSPDQSAAKSPGYVGVGMYSLPPGLG